MRSLLLATILALWAGAVSAQGTSTSEAFHWPGLDVILAADSAIGTVIATKPADRSLSTVFFRQEPGVVRTWARRVAATAATAADSAPITVFGDDSTLVAARTVGQTQHQVVFRNPGQRPYAANVTSEQLAEFADALLRIAAQSYRDPAQPRFHSIDPGGEVVWVTPASSGMTMPRPKDIPAPRFPPELRADGVQGAALLRYVIDVSGATDPSTLRVLWASHPAFGQAAAAALARGRFEVGRRGDQPVRAGVIQFVSFTIGQ